MTLNRAPLSELGTYLGYAIRLMYLAARRASLRLFSPLDFYLGLILEQATSGVGQIISSPTDWTEQPMPVESHTRLVDRNRVAFRSAGDVHNIAG
jgi:hypothetical protein